MNNFVVSLLNHYSNIGFVSLRSAFCYLVDPRNGEADLSIDKLPMTTIMHDILTFMKAVPLFKGFNYFDKSQLLLDDLLYRDYLVGEKLLPFFGFRADTNLKAKLNKLSLELYQIQDKTLKAITPHVFPSDIDGFTKFELDFHYYLRCLVRSFLDGGRDDQVKVVELSMRLKDSIEFKSFEKSAAVREEITQFLEKYRFLETLGNSTHNVGTKIPMPLKDVEHAYSTAKRLTQVTGPESAPLMDYLHLQRSSRGARRNVLLNPKAYL